VCGDTVLKNGDVVVVKKDSHVRTTHPAKDVYMLKRKQSVKVHHVIGNDVVWAGSGGYWCWTDISNVEVL